MFSKPYEQRLLAWRDFRQTLENSENPLQHVIDFYKHAPTTKFQCDPYDQATWPSPWEIIEENKYCEFVKLLAICYTLQLTDRFKHEHFEIHIEYSRSSSNVYYLLYVNNMVIGYDETTYNNTNELPQDFISQQAYVMPPLQ